MINKQLINLSSPASSGGNQEEGLILHLDANDVDSYDGDGSEWVDITNHEYTPATNVSEHFNTVIWDGDSTVNRSITGVGFQPDLVWIKNRNSSYWNLLHDSLRPDGNDYYALRSDGTDAQFENADRFNGFDSDGFTVSYNGLANLGKVNRLGYSFVAWCFKAGGAPSGSDKVSIDGTSYATMSAAELTDGTIPVDKLSVNTKLGFSIATIQNKVLNNGSNIAHGLGVPPELILAKKTDSIDDWIVFSKTEGGNRYLVLNSNSASADDTYWGDANPTSTLINFNWTSAAQDYVFYSFASKRGVSKVGSYTGTGAAGNKVYTGFEPAFIMTKRSSSAGDNWNIIDNVRDTDPDKNSYLRANLSDAEISSSTSITFNRDGFTLNGGSFNTSSQTHIYYAVAKNTNETSLIPDTDLELHLDAASFDGSTETPSTWTDSSGNSNNGTISGATFDSELGNWLDFDGINDIVTTSYDIPSVGAKTIEFWFNDNGSSGNESIYPSPVGGSNAVIWTGADLTSSYSDESLGFYNADTGLHFYIRTGTNAYRDNKWHHVAITDNGSNQHAVYVDGQSHSISYLSGSSSSRISMNSVQIGKGKSTPTTGSYSYYFNGQVGQVRIYSSALTQDQIRQNYNFTKPNYPNGFDGTINGATWNSAGYFQFDGSNDEIELTGAQPYSSQTNQTNSIKSITGWVKLDTGTIAILYSVSSYSNGNDFFTCQIRNDSNGVFMQGRDGSSTNQFTDKATNSAPDSNWHHYVFQIDGDEREIYIDGVKRTLTKDNRGTATDSSWISYISFLQSTKHHIQRGRFTSAYYGTGKISKVKHYTRPLTQEEITALYNEGE